MKTLLLALTATLTAQAALAQQTTLERQADQRSNPPKAAPAPQSPGATLGLNRQPEPPSQAGLLLPAVQAAREPARRSN